LSSMSIERPTKSRGLARACYQVVIERHICSAMRRVLIVLGC
jgi:hypothetical protein